MLNEVAGGGEDGFWLEIANAGTSDFDLTGVEIRRASTGADSYAFPSQTLPVGGVLVVEETALGFDATAGDPLFLVSSGGTTVLDARVVAGGVRGRAVDGTDRWLVPDVATPGTVNSFALHDEIVINEIMYQHRPTLGTAAIPATFEVTPLVPFETNWRYNDAGADLGAGWQQIAHPVGGAWQQGPGLIGFETSPLSRPIGTVLSDPFFSDPFVTTYYFETDFSLTQTDLDDIDELHLRHIIDDGAVFYLNGNEVSRFNMPEGPVNSSTFSSQGVGNASLSDATLLSKELLQVGTNRLSAEVHMALSRFDTDIVFGVELANATEITPAVPSSPFAENSQEWIELYNRGNTSVDLTDWQIDDAVNFTFPAGTSLGPGEYLVVASDAAALQQAYPTQTNILGDFSGSLSNRDERILLLDRVGNPADEVHYFDDGRWDQWADGAGPSLELRDPYSDNSVGEAWSASDEASKSTWQSYSYRGVAAKTIPGEPSVWHELALGFLDGAGEVLIDDIRVVQAPDGAATEMIQNGTFDDGADHWRLLGNHQRSEVIDDNGNQVLHLISSGATEYQGNQIETTFADGNRVVSGQEYEISFRAKWLAGSRQINSRLYFNQLAKTTSLDVPDRNGTPGQPNSRLVANAGPTYNRLRHSPAIPAVNEAITITVEADDPDGVDGMSLWYRVGNAAWTSLPMAAGADGVFSAAMPGQSAGTVVQFYVEGRDTRGAVSQFPAEGP